MSDVGVVATIFNDRANNLPPVVGPFAVVYRESSLASYGKTNGYLGDHFSGE
jgi:hypothetical protein